MNKKKVKIIYYLFSVSFSLYTILNINNVDKRVCTRGDTSIQHLFVYLHLQQIKIK